MDIVMWTNIAPAERCLRAATGFGTIFYLLLVPSLPLFFALAYLASLFLLLTALIGWDPLYAVFYKITYILKTKISNRPLAEKHQLAM